MIKTRGANVVDQIEILKFTYSPFNDVKIVVDTLLSSELIQHANVDVIKYFHHTSSSRVAGPW